MADEKVGGIYYTVEAKTAALLVAQSEVESANRNMQQGFDKTDESVKKVSQSFMKLSGVASAVASALSAREILDYANAWVDLNNKLANSVKELETLSDVTQRVFNISQDTRSSLSATADLYARLERSTRAAGVSTKELTQLTKTINQAFIVSGATSEEAAGAIMQLGQGLAAGALRGEEFNAVAENGSQLALALADSLGVDVGQLRQMAAQGVLTTDVVVKGLLEQGNAIGAEFAKTTLTMGQAFTVATNNITKFVGESSTVQSTVSAINTVVISLSEHLDELSAVFVALAAVMGSRFVGGLTASTMAMLKQAVVSRELVISENEAAQAALNQSAANLRAAEAAKARAIDEIRLAEMMKGSAFSEASLIAAEQNLSAARVAAATATGEYNAALAANAEAQSAAAAAAGRASAGTGLMRGALALVGGPAGAAMLAASAVFYFYQKAKEAREEAIKLADSVNSLTAKMTEMSHVELGTNISKLRAALPELNDAVKEAQDEFKSASDHVKDLQKEVNNWGTSTTRGKQAADALTGALDEQADAAIKLEGAQNQLSQTQEAIGMLQAQMNGQMQHGIELLKRNGDSAGVAAGLYRQFGEALNVATKAQEKFNASSLEVKRNPKVQEELDGLLQENELLKETNLRKREQLKVEQQIRSKGGSEADVRLARERVGANYDLEQAERAKNKATKDGSRADSKAATEEKNRTNQLQDMQNALAVSALEMQNQNREAAQLAAVQKLGANATQGEINAAREQAGAIYDLNQLIKDQQALIETNPVAKENKAFADSQGQLARQKALKDSQGKLLMSEQEYAARSQKLAVEHQQALAKISAEQSVTPMAAAAGEIDPVQALANENTKKLALIKAYEGARVITTGQANELIAAQQTQYEKQRLAALEQQYRAQSELNDFTMSMIDSVGQRMGNMLVGLVTGTQSVSDAMRGLAATILDQAVGALVQMGIQALKNMIIGQTASGAAVAQAAATGPAMAAAYAPAAALASLASFGSNAAAAQVGIASTMALTKTMALAGGRRYGGGVSAGNAYRINESGQSEVFQTAGGAQAFIPNKSGKVIPASDVGASGSPPVNVVINNMASGTQVENQGYNPDTKTITLAVKEVARQLRTRTGDVSRALGDSWNTTGKSQ